MLLTSLLGSNGEEFQPSPQPLVADPTGGMVADTQARAAITDIIDALIANGLMDDS